MRLSVPGRHMALNALGRAAGRGRGRRAGRRRCSTGWPVSRGCAAGSSWSGTACGVRVFDDYAHHPTEIGATLAAVRMLLQQGRHRPVEWWCSSPICIRGQRLSPPSSVTRWMPADEVFVLDVYAAREQPLAGVSGASVAEHVSVPVHYMPDFSAVADAWWPRPPARATSWSPWAPATSRCWDRRS